MQEHLFRGFQSNRRKHFIIKQLAIFKSSLLLKSYLQRIQALQVYKNWKVYTKVIKTKQRGLALFRLRESNAEKRERFLI